MPNISNNQGNMQEGEPQQLQQQQQDLEQNGAVLEESVGTKVEDITSLGQDTITNNMGDSSANVGEAPGSVRDPAIDDEYAQFCKTRFSELVMANPDMATDQNKLAQILANEWSNKLTSRSQQSGVPSTDGGQLNMI